MGGKKKTSRDEIARKELVEQHPELFHYTSFDAFEDIVKSQTLWAKYFRDLNDTTEIFHAETRLADLLTTQLKKYIQQNRSNLKPLIKEARGMRELAKHDAVIAMRSFFEVTFGTDDKLPLFPPYIVSFCCHARSEDEYARENGLLSMWRGYGIDGGVALVFDTGSLNDLFNKEAEKFKYSYGGIGTVVYDDDMEAFEKEMGKAVANIKDDAMEMLLGPEKYEASKDNVVDFLSVATRFKHRAFKEEREVRIIASPWIKQHFTNASKEERGRGKLKPVRKRRGSQFIDLFDNKGIPRLPIKRVIIGPSKDRDGRIKEVKRVLRQRPEIDICVSETPFIWK